MKIEFQYSIVKSSSLCHIYNRHQSLITIDKSMETMDKSLIAILAIFKQQLAFNIVFFWLYIIYIACQLVVYLHNLNCIQYKKKNVGKKYWQCAYAYGFFKAFFKDIPHLNCLCFKSIPVLEEFMKQDSWVSQLPTKLPNAFVFYCFLPSQLPIVP